MAEIRQTISRDNDVIFKLLPYFSPCIIDVILIVVGRVGESPVVVV